MTDPTVSLSQCPCSTLRLSLTFMPQRNKERLLISFFKSKSNPIPTRNPPSPPPLLLLPPNQMPINKKNFTSLFKHRETRTSWPWPSSCNHPRTNSYREEPHPDDIYKTVNSVYLDVPDATPTPESWFTNSSESPSFSTASDESGGGESTETIIRGLRSERFFFEPGDTKSILEEAKGSGGGGGVLPFKGSVALAMESVDPYVDFRVSMEEMVEAHGLKEWECLEELLLWYLRVNGKKTHGFIVGAFVDLLIGILSATPPISSSS